MEEIAVLEEMAREIQNASEIYRPSRFWKEFAQLNVGELSKYGLRNFKRTINQNYYNWIPQNFDDNQMRNVIAFWAQYPDLAPIHTRIEGDGFVENRVTGANPLETPQKRALYALYVGLLWHFVSRHDPYGILSRIAEPGLGNPINVVMGDRLISQDVANSVRELNTILEAYRFPKSQTGEKTSVLEIGAGYGRVAYVIAATFKCRYIIADITPALFVSQWYLSSVFSDAKIFRFRPFDKFDDIAEEFEAADFVFLTPNQLEKIPDNSVDLSLSISSLHEMRPDQNANFKALLQAKTRAAIYCKQWLNFVNQFDGVTMAKPSYDLSDGWVRAIDRVDPIQDLFFETVWLRRPTP